ncbi:cytochrome c biogenesis protein CcsA [Halosquirtibacter laminarini]|uniref:Cytochrome c biogenesis protein CcsA n=1 Tax=Halosquirtibacter laminarini TaxID=3374600 RepID=A0AC61NG15_9BACT|nr:cytochrome c biogenesis protein CcsA [Prolixibacteraceae bacterium]
MNKVKKIFGSTTFTGFLFILIAISLGMATIVETVYDTSTAKIWIYNSTWLEIVYLLFTINLTINIFKFKLFRKEKLPLLLFHLSFILIILGGGVTRYFSHEGLLHLREGETTNRYLSSNKIISIQTTDNHKKKEVLFSAYAGTSYTLHLDGYKVKFSNYNPKVIKELKSSPNGTPTIQIMVIQNFHSQNVILQEGEKIYFGNQSIGFSSQKDSDISIISKNNKLLITSSSPITQMTMSRMAASQVSEPKKTMDFKTRHAYQTNGVQIILMKSLQSAKLVAKTSSKGEYESVTATIEKGHIEREVTIFNQTGLPLTEKTLNIAGNTISLSFGQQELTLPFHLHLKKFILERYNNSNSPSSYRSIVDVLNTQQQKEKSVEISMNNTLHQGRYRFYQTSYDQDEKGTILTVNNDYWGTIVTYLGYFLMILGMTGALFAPKTRFQKLIKRSVTPTLFLLLSLLSPNQAQAKTSQKDVIKEFGKVWVQSHDGRVKPMSTIANDFLRKSMWKTSYKGNSAEEVMWGILTNPQKWSGEPIIKITPYIAGLIHVDSKYASYQDFFNPATRKYILLEEINQAYQKAPNLRHQKDKDLMKVDEKVNIFNLIQNQSILKTFPYKKEKQSTWISPSDIANVSNSSPEELFIKKSWDLIFDEYHSKHYEKAIHYLEAIDKYQKKNAVDLPSERKNKLERVYIHSNIFLYTFILYLIIGFVALFTCFISILRNKEYSKRFNITLDIILVIPFLLHTIGMVLRGIVSGHMPWSNGYESMLYVAWSMMFAGFIFARKNPIILSGAAFLSGITLFIAHLSWMNPEITFLVPVLKSHWLTFHVAIITASYGFIGISMFIGLTNMILWIFTNKKNRTRIEQTISQLSDINEASMILGLYLLTIGTFLGGIWANEAWGRYWGWDPKETWSLVTILVYSFITHMRIIPAFRGNFAFNAASIFGFYAIIMTYLGVNYYLSGLHSYGSGEAGNTSIYCFISILVLTVITLFARWRFRIYFLNKE